MRNCEKCSYFRIEGSAGPTPGGGVIGYCHRFPPTKGKRIPSKQDRAIPRLSNFPLVRARDWCGEFFSSVDEAAVRAVLPLEKSDEQPETMLISCREAAAMLRVSTRRLWRLSNEGQIPRVKIGARVCYRSEALRKWIETQEVRDVTPHA